MTLLATPSKFILYQGNTSVIQLVGLQDYLTQNYLNSATVTGTLQDDQGNNIPECTSISFTYVPASNGSYNGVFGDQNFMPPTGTGYTLLVDANNLNLSYGHWEFMVEIVARQQ
jgi:hypothetical protein